MMNKAKVILLGAVVAAMATSGLMVAQAQPASGAGTHAGYDGGDCELRERGPRDERGERRGDRGDRGGHRHGHGGHHGGMGRMGGGPGGPGGGMFRDIFEAVDADRDGSVTVAEIEAYRGARVAAVDTSGDGALSIEEFDTLYRELTRERMVDAFQELDADGDGAISPEEMTKRIDRMVERMDRDGDGILTLRRPRGPAEE